MIAILAMGALIAAAVLTTWRLIVGPTVADRIVALDVGLMTLMGGLAIEAWRSGDPALLDLLTVVAIVAFAATVAASRFIEQEGELP